MSDLAAVHDLVVELLDELQRATRAARLRFDLAYGTAIGAARDGDLIAWDVDADVWMPREHLDRIAQLSAELGPDFELLSAETHDDYPFLFPRLVHRRIHHSLVRVDLFPLDRAPRDPRWNSLYIAVSHLLCRAYFIKVADRRMRRHYSARKRMAFGFSRVLLALFGRRLLRSAHRAVRRGARGGELLVNSCGSYGLREFFPASAFADSAELPVRGQMFPVPRGYDEVLTGVYGDYRVPVNPDRQRRETAFAIEHYLEPLRASGALRAPETPPAVPQHATRSA